MALIITILVIACIIVAITSYKKVGPNEVLIVTGGFLHGPYVETNEKTHTKVKVIKGGGTFVWPIVQQAQKQSLDTFNIPVKVEDIMTKDMVPVDVSATALLRVGSDPKLIAIAAEKTLGLSEKERTEQLTEIVRGGVREILSDLTPLEANKRGSFQDAVVGAISSTFANLGLEVTKLTITNISDKNGYFESLYAPDVARKAADSRKATAEADKEAAIAETQNQQAATEAQLAADKDIAEHQKETDVAKAQFDAETRKAQAVSEKAGDIASAEQDAIVAQKQIEVNKNKYEATTITEANANSQKLQIDAEAQAKQKQTLADADAYSISKNGEAEADKIAKVGQANAEAQQAIAKALEANGEKALQMKVIEILPELVKSSSESIKSIKDLTVFNGADGVKSMSEVPLAQSFDFIKKSTGLDVKRMLVDQAQGKRTVKLSGEAKDAAKPESNK